MDSPDSKPQQVAEPAPSNSAASEASRTKSIAIWLTEAELERSKRQLSRPGKGYPNGCAIPLSRQSARHSKSRPRRFSWLRLWGCGTLC